MNAEDGGFLSRWARRKAQVREGREPAVPQDPPPGAPAVAAAPTAPATPAATGPAAEALPAEPAPPPPTLDDVAALTAQSDFTRFVTRDVDPSVKNAALKKLFTDPHYNVMDGLDTYIDDYGKPDPLPEGMLRQMVQSKFLGLFADEEKTPEAEPGAVAVAAPTGQGPEPRDIPDEDADLRLQPHDAADAGEPGAGEPGAGEDAAGQP